MGLGGFGGAGPEGPPNVTEGAGQAPPPTGCVRPYSFISPQSRGVTIATAAGKEARQGSTPTLQVLAVAGVGSRSPAVGRSFR
jgi:hypothetical protein